jgi:hypothetical protein
MWRFLFLLVACSSAEAVTSSESTPLVWIDHWVEARECLVVPAEDLETGVAISFLEGRHCDDKLRALERVVPVTDDPLVKSWRLAIARLRHTTFPSAVQRSVEIRIVDNGARLLTALQGRPLAPMPRGPALARAHQRDFVPRPWVTKLGSRFYGVESDSFKAAVNLESLDDYRIAYEIAVTRPDGTWAVLQASREPEGDTSVRLASFDRAARQAGGSILPGPGRTGWFENQHAARRSGAPGTRVPSQRCDLALRRRRVAP